MKDENNYMKRIEEILSKDYKKNEESLNKMCKVFARNIKREAAFSESDSEKGAIMEMLEPFEQLCVNTLDNFVLKRELADIKKIMTEYDYKDQVASYYRMMEGTENEFAEDIPNSPFRRMLKKFGI